MKKLFFVLTVAVLASFTLTSCKKDYVCTCTEPITNTTVPISIENSSKDDAETICNTNNATYALIGGSCKLD